MNLEFKIDRERETCRTPRHNEDIEECCKFFSEMMNWTELVHDAMNFLECHFGQDAECTSEDTDDTFVPKSLFVPCIPLLTNKSDENDASNKCISSHDVQLLLEEESKCLQYEIENVQNQIAKKENKLRFHFTAAESQLKLISFHLREIAEIWFESTGHIEDMLYEQLHTAIGKRLTGKDIDEFVRFHNKRLFSETYAPEEFCYNVRRPNHYPDGIVSIEQQWGQCRSPGPVPCSSPCFAWTCGLDGRT